MATQKEVKFSEKQKFDLLELVQPEPMLWDRQCDAFKMRDAKNDKWVEIARLAGYESGKKASDAWQVLRDEYIKQRKRQSGQGAKVTWKFFEAMSFFASACDPRTGQSSTITMQKARPKAEASSSRLQIDDEDYLDDDLETESVLGDFGSSPSTPGGAPGKKRKLSVEMQILKTLEKSQKDLEASNVRPTRRVERAAGDSQQQRDRRRHSLPDPGIAAAQTVVGIYRAIDGKHIQIKKPPNSGSNYFNYKGHFSMVLLAICDAKYRVIYANFGNYGADSDARIFGRSDFLRLLDSGALNLPADAALPNSETELPYFFVADAAFPLGLNLMKPVPGVGLSVEERRFNYRLSRGRRVIENVFGIMAAKWRILLKPIETTDDNADTIVKAVTVLHNFCIEESSGACMADAGDDNNGAWRTGGTPLESAPVRNNRGNRSKEEAQQMRRTLVAYFSNVGAVEWQDDYL